MSKGYEGFIWVGPENEGWNGTTTAVRGNFLFADDEDMGPNKEFEDRVGKLTFGRGQKASSRRNGGQTPGGDVNFQFRSDDLPMILMSHFQKFTGTQFGTLGSSQFTFVPEKGSPDFVGSTFGTGSYTSVAGDLFTVRVVKKLFDTEDTGSANAMVFKSCFVDELEFSLAADDDARLKASFKAGGFDAGTQYPASINPNSSLGSYSTKPAFEHWSGTVVAAGVGSFNILKFSFMSKLNAEDRTYIGSLNPGQYSFGKHEVTGNFEIDMPRDGLKHVNNMLGGSSFAITATLYNGTSDWLTFSMPNCRWGDFAPKLKGGDAYTEFNPPFVAYESESGAVAPITVVVHTETYGSVPWVRV